MCPSSALSGAKDGGSSDMPQRRHAVYYAPERGSPLDRFGGRWLGRDAWTGEPLDLPPLEGLTAERHREITADARRYGFHATLKPPFALAADCSTQALREAVAEFAARQAPFETPPLMLAALGGFLALVPSAPCAALERLAAAAVRDLDAFRAPPSPAELDRRRAAGLTARQEEHLRRWGYPYVMDEFRFHLTLTARLAAPERGRVARLLQPLTAPLCRDPLPVESICIFEQEMPEAPFRIAGRFRLGGRPPQHDAA